MNLDILFIDTVCPQPYDSTTLQTQGLGGTEATVIRVAESLASCDLKVGIINHLLTQEQMGTNVWYLPLHYLTTVKAKAVVGLRSPKHIAGFSRSKKVMWCHDLAHKNTLAELEYCAKNEIEVVGVSKWHKNNLTEVLHKEYAATNKLSDATLKGIAKVSYIYNPVQDNIYVPKNVEVPYDKNKLVWLSSPHKGLEDAVRIFKNLKEVSGNNAFTLHVYNPGYIRSTVNSSIDIILHDAQPPQKVWESTSTSLCVFYPTTWQETFGLVAAEANAVKCPIATYELAALAEIVPKNQVVPIRDEKALIDKVISWHKSDRPNVYGNPNFKLSTVTLEWIKKLLC